MDGSSIAGERRRHDLLMRSLSEEHGFVPLRVEGRLPGSLRGTLYRTGPGLFEVAGRKIAHLFEGDGAVAAVRFDGQGASGAHRLIESEGLKEERLAKKALFGGAATWPDRMRSVLARKGKNTGNTNLLSHRGRLFALMEAAIPTELDPDTLETLGATRFDQTIRQSFSAHPHHVPSRKATYNFGLRYGRTTYLDLYELPDDAPIRHLGAVPLAMPVMLHDFVATERHLVFFVSPFRFELHKLLLGIRDFTKALSWEPAQGTEILIVPIDAPERVRRFRVDAFFQWHFANAFERADELVVDFVHYADASSIESIGTDTPLGGQTMRATIPHGRDTIAFVPLASHDGDFPLVDPRFSGVEHRTIFTTYDGRGENGLARIDVATGKTTLFRDSLSRYYSEAILVPSHAGAEDGEGHLLSLVLDGKSERAYVAVFDAEHLADGPVAKAWFAHHVPITFHGQFVPAHSGSVSAG